MLHEIFLTNYEIYGNEIYNENHKCISTKLGEQKIVILIKYLILFISNTRKKHI